ncbi:transcription factor bHLH104-like [Argentina anserina]|uniref:transcription factor bHLH104-like n=1 Tax=Argentina anserina TaxID=57926 RepID=UPI0021762442|nr:transcription factor bHLH104-like [Potentilla anserina]
MDGMEGIEDFFVYNNLIDETQFPHYLWSNPNPNPNPTPSFSEIEFSANSYSCVAAPSSHTQEKEVSRKRGRTESWCGSGAKACREKLRRERLNDKFLDLSAVLEPGRPAKSDKPAILDDAIRVLTQLRAEAQELTLTNEKLLEEIKSLKAEKSELREEKVVLKADKEKLEQQLKAMSIPASGFMPAHQAVPAAYHPGAAKMAVYPSYGMVPMWHYLPPSTRDTSRDHELRPPAA